MAKKVLLKKKNKGGRPTKYKEEYCQKIIKFFSRDHTKVLIDTVTYKNGTIKEVEREVANTLPTFERFAFEIGVNRDTLREWRDRHKMFSASYKRAKGLQKDMIIDLGLRGLYNATFSIFTAKNVTDMRDKGEIDVTSKGEKLESFNLTAFIKDLKKMTDEDKLTKAGESANK